MKTLPDTFWTIPSVAHTTLTTKELREVMLNLGGQIMAHGRLWDIKKKSLGAGVYKVWLSLDES